jgi:hypothetical protein
MPVWQILTREGEDCQWQSEFSLLGRLGEILPQAHDKESPHPHQKGLSERKVFFVGVKSV